MTLEQIEQAARTIVESAYDYDNALQKNDQQKIKQTKEYILKICENIKKWAEEEKNG